MAKYYYFASSWIVNSFLKFLLLHLTVVRSPRAVLMSWYSLWSQLHRTTRRKIAMRPACAKQLARLCQKSNSQVLVAHTCNPSYTGGRDQEDRSLKLAWTNSLRDPISKKNITKRGSWSGSRCKPWVQTSVPQKKKKREKEKTPEHGVHTL
jgi:hypothetical protein